MAKPNHGAGGNALLTLEQVIKIRQMARERFPSGRLVHSANSIAAMLEEWTGLSLSAEAIRRVIRRETWRHVPDVPTVEEANAAMAPEIPLSEKVALEASALRAWKVQQETKGQALLDELTAPPKEEGK